MVERDKAHGDDDDDDDEREDDSKARERESCVAAMRD